MVKGLLHGNMTSYFYIDSIAKMLTARPDNDVTKSYKFKKSFDIKMPRSSKNTYVSRNNANVM